MLLVSGEVISCDVDYLTLTKTTKIDDAQLPLGEGYDQILSIFAETSQGSETSKVKFGGYSGIGYRYGRVGSRRRGDYVDSIGVFSSVGAIDCLDIIMSTDFDGNCTRIDLQATVLLSEPDINLARRYADTMKCDKGYRSSMVGRRALSVVDSDTGQTLYIGKRSTKSSLYRIYDKSLHYNQKLGTVWRFEVEFKRNMSPQILDTILTSEDVLLSIQKIVRHYFSQNCGVEIRELPNGDIRIKDGYKASDGSISWLEKCVRPVVVKEINRGRIDQVLDALGLSWVVEDEQIEMRAVKKAYGELIAQLSSRD